VGAGGKGMGRPNEPRLKRETGLFCLELKRVQVRNHTFLKLRKFIGGASTREREGRVGEGENETDV